MQRGYSLQQGPAALKKINSDGNFVTVGSAGKDKFGMDVLPKSAYSLRAIPDSITAVVYNEETGIYTITIPSHAAKKHMFVRFATGANAGIETPIFGVPSVNTIQIYGGKGANSHLDAVIIGDTVKILSYITPATDADGNVNFSPGPTQFVQDGIATQVIEDTATPANNKGLPSQLMIYKEGVQVPVADHADPAQVSAIPVKIMDAGGTTINITAGDINIQSTDMGVNFDSSRIGDGSGNYVGVNADSEMLVKDADVLTEVAAINLKTPALVAGKVPVDTGLVQGLTDAQLRNSPVPISGTVTTGGLTDTQLRASPISVSGPLTDTQLRATPVPISGALTDAQLRAAAVDVASTQLPATLGQKTAANSVSVVLASGTGLTVTNGATEAKQDAQILELQDIETDIEATKAAVDLATAAVSAMSNKLPATIGQKTSANSLSVVIASDAALPTTAAARVPSYQEDLNVTTSVETITAPAGAKWCKIQADDANTGNMRIKLGAAATISSGIQLQPGRAEDFDVAGDISYCMESGTGKIYVIFGV